MSSRLIDDRPLQLLIGRDDGLDIDEARRRLERASIVISAADACRFPWGQAALLTIAVCATRMFRGGVYFAVDRDIPVTVGLSRPGALRRRLLELGCREEAPPEHAVTIHVGCDNEKAATVRCWADGWTAAVSPKPPSDVHFPGNEISGALAGAMATSEAFRKTVLDDVRACKQTHQLSAFTPANPEPTEFELALLPASCWMLGLGNLGQALIWILGLLPYADPGEVTLLLQDMDISSAENLDVQVLTTHNWVGRRKARAAADWAEALGFRTVINERRFGPTTSRSPEEPGLSLVGVDNLAARRFVARHGAGFDLVLDAGLGGTAGEIFDIRLHGFPGFRTPEIAWPEVAAASSPRNPELSPTLSKLVGQGRLDMCGALRIAGQSVGVPSSAVAAAAIQIGQACRAIATSTYCDLVDVSLANPGRAGAHEARLDRGGVLQFQRRRKLLHAGNQ